MDRKSISILAVSILLLMAWYPITNRIFPPKPAPVHPNHTNTTASASTNAGGRTSTISAAPGTSTNRLTSADIAPRATNLPPREERTVTLETADARYVFTSLGGGLKLIELKHFPAEAGCTDKNSTKTNAIVTLNTKAPVPAFGITEDGDPNSLASFTLTSTGDTVRAEAPLTNGLYLIKEFHLSTNYLLKATVRYENRSTQSVTLPERELVIGTATPMGRRNESIYVGLEWFNGNSDTKITEPWFANKSLGCIPGTPRTLYRAGASNVFWAAVQNQFFTIIGLPETPASEIVGRRITLPPPTKEELAADPKAFATPLGYQTALVLPSSAMPAQTFVEHRFDFFAGPKEFKTLQKLPRDMDRVMGFSGFFGFFAKILLLSMNGLHAIGIAYGLAIIVITVIIKSAFWPLTMASTRSMKRMQALQPEMKAIQAKYKDDPKKMNQKVMEFMKENKVSPLGGCLPVVLQIPVFFGFYRMLQTAIELRGAHFLWACDLSQPDTVFYLAGFPINPLPIVMGITMLWQAQLTPPSPGIDPGQQKIMRYMPMMMVVFLYNFSAGLCLYWTAQNLLSITQMKLTRTPPNGEKGGVKPGMPPKPVQPPKRK
jgi:YidC/Oxa1 family membrane protein insertase